MTIWVFRMVFLLAAAGIGYRVAHLTERLDGSGVAYRDFWGIIVAIVLAVLMIGIENIFSRRPARAIGAVLFGLIAGFIIAHLLFQVVSLAVGERTYDDLGFDLATDFEQSVKLMLVAAFTYIGIAVLYKTRDQFRFILPYVEFRREQKGLLPTLLDTSAIIDGRIGEICQTGILEGPLLVPKFVLQELHDLSDSADAVRRRRGRRGLDMLHRLQRNESIDVQLHEGRPAAGSSVDAKLVSLAAGIEARIITCDYNLGKIAELQGVQIININELANSLRPIAIAGEEIQVKLIRPGDEPGQGVGFMPDGTMVVVEQGRERIGANVGVSVTNVLQTSAGRMIFGRLKPKGDDNSGNGRKS